MSAGEEMDFQSLPSRSIDIAPRSTAHRRSTVKRRGRSLNSSNVQNVTLTSTRTTSTPKPTSRRRQRHRSNQTPINNPSSTSTNEHNGNVPDSSLSPIPPPDPTLQSQLPVLSLPFDCPSDDEQHQKQNTVTTRSGKVKKDEVLSYFTLREDKKYDCNICQQVYFIFTLKIT
jgi:hypothetical protein